MIETFKSPFIFWTPVPNHKQIKKKILPQIRQTYLEEKENLLIKRWDCKVFSSIELSLPYFDEEFVTSVIWNSFDKMLTEVDLVEYPSNSRLNEVWFNYYPKGGYQEVHTHEDTSGTTFSGVYLLDVNGANTTSFVVMDQIFYLNHSINTKNCDSIKEGVVIIFPANLAHYVNPTLDNRYTVSFNITSNF